MPKAPNAVYPAQDKSFVVVRPYLSEIWFALESHLSYTHVDNEFVFLYSPIPTYRAYLTFYPNFWFWDNNKRTLDHIVQYFYDKTTPTSPENAVYCEIKYIRDTDTRRRAIHIRTVSATINSKITLPHSTGAYWSPLAEGQLT